MGALGGFAEQVLELGEDLLDRVQVRRVGREEQQPCPGSADGLADGGPLVAREVVHDDDVAGRECRHEALLDIGGEAVPVDRLVEHAGRVDSVAAQRRQERHRPPMAVGHLGVKPPAAPCPASERRHIGLGPGLIDKDEALGIKPALILLPLLAPPRDLGPELFGGKHAFF